MTVQFTALARQAAADKAITAHEILALRRAGWSDGVIGAGEAEALFELNESLAEPTGEWCDFFVEAIGEYVINGVAPRGYISDENARWLIDRLDKSGHLDSFTELELLVRVMERATNSPEVLKAYVLEQIEHAVLAGVGPTRDGGELTHGNVSEAEARILRRVLFAPGSDGPASVSRREAELLFRLKDATVDARNAPEWKRLFVQGVGNYLQGASSDSAQLSRERAAELETFMARPGDGVGRFLVSMSRATPNVFGVTFGRKVPERDRLAALQEAEKVTSDEQAWLDDRIGADARIDDFEKALLEFLAEVA